MRRHSAAEIHCAVCPDTGAICAVQPDTHIKSPATTGVGSTSGWLGSEEGEVADPNYLILFDLISPRP
jgi:hypothetical protein